MTVSKSRLILQAAIEVFNSLGIRKTSLEDIARTAGISRSSIYVYFENKDVLFQEAVREISRREQEELLSALSTSRGTFSEIFEQSLDAIHNKYFTHFAQELYLELFVMKFPGSKEAIVESETLMIEKIVEKMVELDDQSLTQLRSDFLSKNADAMFNASKGMVFCYDSLEAYRTQRKFVIQAFATTLEI